MTDYIHGFTPSEQQRLGLMQTILNEAQLRTMSLEGVRSIVDVGSGLGQLSRAFARALGPGGRVVGIELNEQQLAEARRQAEEAGESELVQFRCGEAERLPLANAERGSFDLAHARFLLEHVRDPLAVVRGMVAAVRPGGRIVLIDDDHELLRLWPECPPLARVWQVYWESYRDRGHDPLVGRRLPELLHQAGARPRRITTVFYGDMQGGRLFEAVVDNLIGVLSGAARTLDSAGALPRSEMDAALTSLDGWRRRPAACVWYSLPLAEGIRVD